MSWNDLQRRFAPTPQSSGHHPDARTPAGLSYPQPYQTYGAQRDPETNADLQRCTISVSRLTPSRPEGVAGFYRNYAGTSLSTIEEIVKNDFQRGDYRFELRKGDGTILRSWTKTLAGGPPRDSNGNEIEDRMAINRSSLAYPTTQGPAVAMSENRTLGREGPNHPEYSESGISVYQSATIRDLKIELEATKNRCNDLENQLTNQRSRAQAAETKVSLLEDQLKREKENQSVLSNLQLELERAKIQQNANQPNMQLELMKMQQQAQSAQQDMMMKIMLQGSKNNGAGSLMDTLSIFREIQEMSGGGEGKDGSDSMIKDIFSGLGSVFGSVLESQRQAQQLQQQTPQLPQQLPQPQQLLQQTQHQQPQRLQQQKEPEMAADREVFATRELAVNLGESLKRIRSNMNDLELGLEADRFLAESLKHITPRGRKFLVEELDPNDQGSLINMLSGVEGMRVGPFLTRLLMNPHWKVFLGIVAKKFNAQLSAQVENLKETEMETEKA